MTAIKTTGFSKKEVAEYQKKIDEMRGKVNYAEAYTPHKAGYYRHLLIELLNAAPVQCR